MQRLLVGLSVLALIVTPVIAQGPPFPVFPKKEEPKKTAPKKAADNGKGEKKGGPPPWAGSGEAWRYRYRGPVIKHGGDLYRWDRRDDRYERLRRP